MIKIGFWDNQLCERGTTIALYDYAYYNQKIFDNESYIFYDKNNINNNEEVIKKFTKEFVVIPVDSFSEVDIYLKELDIRILYNIKEGGNDGKISKYANNVIHCVFSSREPHGEVYSSISKYVSHYNDNIPVLPHIVHLPYHEENMRKELNIPDDATVFGRHGGKGQFDIPFVQQIVYQIAKANPNIYFLFVNTNEFCEKLPNIIHIDAIIDLHLKRKFINTCDAMIHARSDSETFGLSIAEFSICNKPVISYNVVGGYNAHIEILGEKGLIYNNPNELVNFIATIASTNKKDLQSYDWNAFKEYSPEKVMITFYKLAISPFVEIKKPS